MAVNVNLQTLSTLNNTSILTQSNSNFSNIQTALQKAVSTDGESPNQMLSNLDMNNNQILNLPPPGSTNSPARLVDVVSNPTITVPPTGTSGATVPFLNGNNTWSGTNTFPAGSLTLSELATISNNTILGNVSGGTASPVALTGAQTEQLLQFTQSGTGAIQRTLDSKVKEIVSVLDFGADPTGATDSAPAIQNAINSLSTTGGIVRFPNGTYKVNSSLNIGNGSLGVYSTIWDIYLEGYTVPPPPDAMLAGYPSSAGRGARIVWGGGAGGRIINIKGPLQGWGISNLMLDGNGVAAVGLDVISGRLGRSRNVSIQGCQVAAVKSETFPQIINAGDCDSFGNHYTDFTITVPNVAGNLGVWLTGNGLDTTTDTDYNVWDNLTIHLLGTAASIALKLQATDGNFFYHFKPIIDGSQQPIQFDYTFSSVWPGGNLFFGLEPGVAVNLGSPGSGSRPNVFFGILESNNNSYIADLNLANVQLSIPQVMGPVVNLTGQTVAIPQTNLQTPAVWNAGLYRINYYINITTVGTGGTISATFSWGDGTAVQSSTTSTLSTTSTTGFLSGSLLIYSGAISNINYSTTFSGVTGSPQYSVRITLERLN